MYMEDGTPDGATLVQSVTDGLLRIAQVQWSDTTPMRQVKKSFGTEKLSALTLFVSPMADFASVTRDAARMFPDTNVVACTTAGEIGQAGYDDGLILAVGFPESSFSSAALLIEDLDTLDAQPLIDRVTMKRIALQDANPDKENGFGFLVVDGLSLCEDMLVSTLAPALRDMPIFGGSAGDGTRFRETLVSLNGQIARNAAVLNLIRSQHRARVFSLDHLVPTDTRMVVTDADPARRIVKSINAEPAAREYARIVGKDPNQLDRFTFASHPVVVRIGDDHHVRAIQQVNEKGELVFFSAIDEGMVLTVAKAQNMVDHLSQKLSELSQDGVPENILACDCILRRIEAEQCQASRDLSEVMSDHKIVGFCTYGEQIGPLHVNHTMSGVAFYRSEPGNSA